MANVTDLQSRIASVVDLDVDAPTAGGDDWNLRLKFLNRAQSRWEEAYHWRALYKESYTNASLATGNASISMPTDFKKLAGYPRIIRDSTEISREYAEIDPQARGMYSEVERYCYVMGEESGGYNLIIHPGSMSSGASVYYPYWAHAASLASPANVSMCPDPEYLVTDAIGQLWESREDPRYPEMKLESDRRLAQMIENENTRGYGYDNKASVPEETKYSFRMGRD